MTNVAVIEDQRTTQYRHRLAALLRRPSCQWIAFAIGTAPVHRGFFAEVASAIEGLPTGNVLERNGVTHRQVQYGVRLKLDAMAAGAARFDPTRALLAVAGEDDLDDVDGQAALVAAAVHLGLRLADRTLHAHDSDCAARIAGHLHRIFETIDADDDEPATTARLDELVPDAPAERAFFDVAADIYRHHRLTCLAGVRTRHPLAPGSFMKIIGIPQREKLHALLEQEATRRARHARPGQAERDGWRAVRFLALQATAPALHA